MNFKLASIDLAKAAHHRCDAMIVLFDRLPTSAPTDSDPILLRLAGSGLKLGSLSSKTGGVLSSFQVPGVAAPHFALACCVDASPLQLRRAIKAAFASIKSSSPKRLMICLAGLTHTTDAALVAVMESIAEVSYVYTHTKSKATGRALTEVTMGVTDVPAFQGAFDRAVATIGAIELAKEWANRPGNFATPKDLAEAGQQLTRYKRIKCEVLGKKEIQKLGMGSFLAVAKGSSQAPQFIVLQYRGGEKDQAPVALIGKGITFDSGGISLKPGPEMDEMKFDMCGAASVLGVFQGLGHLQPSINVVGLIPACENLPGPDALKPGDVVTAMDGQTIEVLNTDAEGRLILCDALTYAKRLNPCATIDIATLTGACVIALGSVRTGLFSNQDDLADQLLKAADVSQDLCWRMPLDEDYAVGLKTNFADVANVAGRAGGAITAAKFLQRFTADMAWAHLDIAGTAWRSGAEKGATGRPVPLLLAYLLALVPSPAARKRSARPRAASRAR